MARLGVVHYDLMQRGGSEAVSANVVEALQDDHELTLVTTRPPDFETLNDYYDAAIDDLRVRCPGGLSSALETVSHTVNRISSRQFGMLEEAALLRYARSIQDEFDAMFSTRDECCFDVPSIQYVHYPRKGLMSRHRRRDGRNRPDIEGSELRDWYDQLCLTVSGFAIDEFDPTAVLTNSKWTAGVIERVHGTSPRVVYPPVDTRGFGEIPWDAREDGFLCVGRLSPDKNVLRNIRVIDRLREAGHDVHLHVVGPAVEREYHERITRAVRRRDHVVLEGAVSRERLVDLVQSHRYAIHGKEDEHFGMVVAEFLAGGAVPFVPDDGGQCEIVGEREELTYSSVDDAVRKIDRVLSSPARQHRLRTDPDRIRDRYGRERFQREIRDVVNGVVR